MEAGAANADPSGKPRRFSIMVDGATDAFAVGCRGGGCGTCRVRVRAGTYRTGRMSRAHVTLEEEREGYALACKLFPLEDLLLVPARRAFAPGGQPREN
jgi:ferredoxin